MAITLHHHDYWPASMAAKIACADAGVSPTISTVTPPKPANAGPARLVDTNGFHNDTFEVWEGMGCITYLHERRNAHNGVDFIPPVPCMIPLTFQWSSWAARELLPPVETLLLHGLITTGSATEFDRAKDLAAGALDYLETQVPAAGKFINREDPDPHGNNQAGRYGMADLLVGAAVSYLRLMEPSEQIFDTAAKHQKVHAYVESLEQRTHWNAALKDLTFGNPPKQIKRP